MRIVYLIARSDSIGGYHIHVRDLATVMKARGHEPIVVMGGEGPFVDDLVERGIPYFSSRHLIREVRPWKDAAAFAELRSILKRVQPDLVSTHGAKSGSLGRAVSRSLNIPVITTAHGWSFTTGVPAASARLYRWGEWITMACAARVITVSEYDRQLALQHRVARPEQLITVHNGMRDIDRGLLARPEHAPPRIVMIARFEPQKDYATLLRALARLRDSAWELELIGDGPLRPDMEGLSNQLGIGDRVQFLGARRDVAQRLAQAQLFVLSSNWEGFPRTILEAMRAGLPTIASDVGGVSESVVEGTTGFIVRQGDVDNLQDRLAVLIGDAQLRATMGNAARARFEEHFTFEQMLERTLAVYREVLHLDQDHGEVDVVSSPAATRRPGREPQRARVSTT